ncbi:MAG: sigma 54-interacting transcriptional regulator [Myxococcota bacterium]
MASEPSDSDERRTKVLGGRFASVGDFILRVLSGELRGQEAVLTRGAPFVVGSSFDATLRLPDGAVSRRHLELSIDDAGSVRARDLDSTNGSYYEGSRFKVLDLGPGAVVRVGETDLQLLSPEHADPLPPSEATEFGRLIGKSRRMREVFAVLERAAEGDATVLVTGETGTGKEEVASAIHRASARRAGPFVVVDCGSIPGSLIESELFGHVKGAFTSAMSDRVGAFEAADGGTIFLDEIGEMPMELQPRLLRALETRSIKRVGANEFRRIDVRVVAATNRDLEEEVAAKRFRADLFFRLAVVRVALPPLRARRDDIALLAEHFLREIKGGELDLTPELLATLSSYDWPGNVRELRNVLHQAASVSSQGLSLALRLRQKQEASRSQQGGGAGDDPEIPGFQAYFHLPYKEARRQALEAFELAYAKNAVAAAGGNVSRAADKAEVHRNVLHRILAARKEDDTD